VIVRLHTHALERLAERGATEEEVRATVLGACPTLPKMTDLGGVRSLWLSRDR